MKKRIKLFWAGILLTAALLTGCSQAGEPNPVPLPGEAPAGPPAAAQPAGEPSPSAASDNAPAQPEQTRPPEAAPSAQAQTEEKRADPALLSWVGEYFCAKSWYDDNNVKFVDEYGLLIYEEGGEVFANFSGWLTEDIHGSLFRLKLQGDERALELLFVEAVEEPFYMPQTNESLPPAGETALRLRWEGETLRTEWTLWYDNRGDFIGFARIEENAPGADLSGWLGTYYCGMDRDCTCIIYEEKGRYYADLQGGGMLLAIDSALVRGDENRIEIIYFGCPDTAVDFEGFHLGDWVFRLSREGDGIHTEWPEPMYTHSWDRYRPEDRQFEKVELSPWLGEWRFYEEKGDDWRSYLLTVEGDPRAQEGHFTMIVTGPQGEQKHWGEVYIIPGGFGIMYHGVHDTLIWIGTDDNGIYSGYITEWWAFDPLVGASEQETNGLCFVKVTDEPIPSPPTGR